MSDLLFSADTHFGHKTMVTKYRAQLAFSTVDQMDEFLILQWNQRVQPGDTVHFLGDFSFYNRGKAEEILAKLNGEIHMTLGNHDNAKKLPEGFASVERYREIRDDDGRRIVLFHFPIEDWHGIHTGSWHLHGHSHGNSETAPDLARLDVGVDASPWWGPVPIGAVRSIMTGRRGTARGHHQPRAT